VKDCVRGERLIPNRGTQSWPIEDSRPGSELVSSAQSGDREAFDRLATAVYDRLYAVARRILGDDYDAEEAV
jgi:hypothetical protein